MSDQPVLAPPPSHAEIRAELEAMVVGDIPRLHHADSTGTRWEAVVGSAREEAGGDLPTWGDFLDCGE